MVFVSFRIFFCRAKREFFPQNLTLSYMTKTLNQIIIFFLNQNQNIFFSNIGNQNIFFSNIGNQNIFLDLNCPFLIAPSVFSNVYQGRNFFVHFQSF
jgi:hypothetical protein